MAFRLDKQDGKRREKLVETLRAKAGELEDAVSVFNEAVTTLKTPVEAALAAYNEAVTEARGFAEDIASTADAEIDDKSERWQQSDKGQAAAEWKGEWEGLSLDDVEIEWPEELKIENVDHADTLEGASEEASA